MAATGFTPVYLYASGTAGHIPLAANLTNTTNGSEIALNYADGNLFFKNASNAVITTPLLQASGSQSGWLSSTDWTTFNSKQPAGTYVTSVSGTSPIASSGGTTPTISLGTVPIANGGTNATSFNAPASSINGLVWYDGTRLVNDATTSDIGYNASTNTLYAKNTNTSGNAQLGAEYTTSALLIGVNGSFIGRKSSDGSTVINTGQGSIIFGSGSTSSYSTLASINGSTGLFSFPFQAQCGNDYTTSSYQISTFGSYLGRDSSDGSTKLYTGQASIRFGSGSTEWMRIGAGVSIGDTTDPGAGSLRVVNNSDSNATTLFQNAGLNATCVMQATSTSYNSTMLTMNNYTAFGNTWRFLGGYSDTWQGPRIVIYGNGDLANKNGVYGTYSDIKLKENIVNTTPKLESLRKVRIVNYNLKEDAKQKLLGVIAQELEQVFPGMVDDTADLDKDGNDLGTTTKSVKMSVFVPMLIKAVQELADKLDSYIESHP